MSVDLTCLKVVAVNDALGSDVSKDCVISKQCYFFSYTIFMYFSVQREAEKKLS